MSISRRNLITAATAFAAFPKTALAVAPREITWDELIPAGLPYPEIVGEGIIDEVNDTWQPVFDENATKLNDDLNGIYIKMPGFIIPIELSTEGVTSFVLVPYIGACIHTPPPPPNQLVFVTSEIPWPNDDLWEAVWVTGKIQHELQSTEVAQTGYTLIANQMEIYVW